MQTRIITGVITRIYRGADLQYSGWQRSTFCSPEALFEGIELPIPGYVPRTLKSSLTPEQSLEFLKETIRKVCGDIPEFQFIGRNKLRHSLSFIDISWRMRKLRSTNRDLPP